MSHPATAFSPLVNFWVFEPHLDDSKQWRVESFHCPDCHQHHVIVHRVDRAFVCPHCVITDRAEPLS